MFAEAGQSFYAQGQPSDGAKAESGPGPEAKPEGGKAEDVVEADYEIVDDSKK